LLFVGVVSAVAAIFGNFFESGSILTGLEGFLFALNTNLQLIDVSPSLETIHDSALATLKLGAFLSIRAIIIEDFIIHITHCE
jgi:hypothetical protein